MSSDSLKELLELLERSEKKEGVKSPSTPKSFAERSVNDFIKHFNIRAGIDRIPSYIVFFFYRERAPGAKNHKLKRITFFKEFGKLFPRTRVGKQRYYLLDKSSFDLTKETLAEASYYKSDGRKKKPTNERRIKAHGSKKEKEEPKNE